MPRQFRKLSKTNTYHVMVRGNERKNVFEDYNDKSKFIDILHEKNVDEKYSLYAYCVMDNHVHLVIENKADQLCNIMKSINTAYACYYNKKYDRVGHLFQDRFKSEEIENEKYLLNVIRYIHNNPIKANIINNINDYKWSSYKSYIDGNSKIVDIEFVLNMFSNNRKIALEKFVEYSKVIETEEFMDNDSVYNNRMSDKEADTYINDYLSIVGVRGMKKDNRTRRELMQEVIIYLKKNDRLSLRQIAKSLGISKSMVARAN